MPTTIGSLSEFELIARITSRLAPTHDVLIGPGDDAALLRAPDSRVVATTDLLVEGRHFRRDWSRPRDVGHKAAAQNLADVAAMGARPTGLLFGFAAPPELPVSWAEELAEGLAAECAAAGAAVVGGDVVRASELTLAITALGDLAGAAPVRRGGARPGDLVAVAGRLGWSAAGLALLADPPADPADPAAAAVVAEHRRPSPPYPAGPEAARLRATAMIDVSDGLVQDLGHIAAAGGVRVELDSAALRPDPELAAACALLDGADPLAFMLNGGEDHALAASFRPGTPLPRHWRTVGRIGIGSGVLLDGSPVNPSGWDHFGRGAPG
ncbi:thiamine-phosphate kinase [Allonocardiopsis opalescens]|uniref:Thiamine-monophosphate kinase n=1 Tax=Allonocardiopsis opalescens TaxID=1144618 RepID=A0A2T0PVS7_9ACTN|nr:thiamine-phosphate kinase [Allonocardiopsis opalescens]PRX95644.1 thiamine-phosphate kinase [Allonocardiopsis opalescens]